VSHVDAAPSHDDQQAPPVDDRIYEHTA